MIERIKDLTGRESLKSYDLSFLSNSKYGGWKIEKDASRFIGRACETLRPQCVLEFGTGLSTVILAQEASKGNVGKIYSIDHLKDFSGHPRKVLSEKGEAGPVTFCHFPIRLTYLAGKILQFYSIPKDFLKSIGPLDLVIIDGPPYYYNSREAALYAVYPYLSPDSLVLLDDAGRKNREGVYLKNWKQYFGSTIESITFLDEFKKGLACIRPTGHQGCVSKFTGAQRIRASLLSLRCELLRIARYIYRALFRRNEGCLQ